MANSVTAAAQKKIKEAANVLSGYPGIFRHLAGEHGEVSALMKKVAGSSEGSSVREELFPEIYESLLAHSNAEEQEFYPTLQRFPQTKDLVAKARQEHAKVKEYLEALASGNKATKTWMQTFERMMRAVEAHVDMEENEMFPAARDLLSSDEAREMERRYEKAEEREKKRA